MKIYIDPGYYTFSRANPADDLIDDEYGVVNTIAEELTALLRESGFDVLVSSPTPDTRLGPGRSNTAALRVNEANNWGADYYIILQLNYSRDPFTTGSDASIYRPTSAAKPLAESILKRLHLSTTLQNRGVNIRPDIYTLGRTNMPALVVGMGYSTNEVDAELLVEHPELFAQGIANGVIAYTQASSSAPTSAEIRRGEVKSAYYQLYPEMSKGSCRLNIDVGSGKRKRTPVSEAEVTVYEGSGGKRLLVYRGKTDRTGRTIPVELPLTGAPGGKYEAQPRMFCVCVRHPEYLPQNQWVDLTDQKSIDKSLTLEERSAAR